MNDQWLNDLKRQMDGYETDVPEGLWEGIESALSDKKPAAPAPVSAPKAPKVMPLWTRIASVAAVLAAIIIGTDLLLRHDGSLTTIDSQIAAVDPKVSGSSTASVNPIAEKPAEQTIVPSTDTPDRPIASARPAAATHAKTDTPTTPPVETVAASEPSVTESDHADNPVNGATEPTDSTDSTPVYRRPLPAPEMLPEARRRKKHYYANALPSRRRSDAGRISVGLNTGSGYAFELKGYDHDMAAIENPISPPHHLGNPDSNLSNSLQEIEKREPSFDPKSESEPEHSLPLRIAATVSYAVTDRFSIESGLTFTSLHSDVRYGYGYNGSFFEGTSTKYNSWRGDRNLFYLGIPVNVRYTFASGSIFDFYGSGGFAVEKCVAGNTKIHCISKGFEDADPRSFTSRVDPLQWSVRASLGLQWRLTSQLGLYVEPGISYFFNNHSDSHNRALPISTYYTEYPFSYSLSVGLRLMLPR